MEEHALSDHDRKMLADTFDERRASVEREIQRDIEAFWQEVEAKKQAAEAERLAAAKKAAPSPVGESD